MTGRILQTLERTGPRGAALKGCRLLTASLAAAALVVTGALPVCARDLYETEIELLVFPRLTDSSNKLTDIDDFYSEENLRELFTSWDPSTNPKPRIAASLDVHGLTLALGFRDNEDELYVVIPGVISTTFTGNGDRDSALDEFKDWLRGTADTIDSAELKQLLHAIVRHSPVDPVAGNPNSLMAQMVDADWRAGMRGPHERGVKAGVVSNFFGVQPGVSHARGCVDGCTGVEAVDAAWQGGARPAHEAAVTGVGVPNFFGASPGVSYAEACVNGCMTVATVALPLTYDLHFDAAPISLLMDLPLLVTWTQGQWSVVASAGLAGRYRVRDGWSLTLGFRTGAVGSLNVGALAMMFDISLENRYEWDWGPLRVGMGNQLVFIKTFDEIELGGFAINYGLQNEVLRNGLDFAGDLGRYFGRDFRWSLFGDYSHYFGTELWAQDMGEAGTTLHIMRDIDGRAFDRARVSLRYFGARAYNGVRLDVELLF
jgi:hypothetical protein